MSPFVREMGEMIVVTLTKLSDREIEPHVQRRVAQFLSAPRTTRELYDFLCTIGAEPVQRFEIDGKRFCTGNVSAFVQSVCDLPRYYERPEEGGEAILIDTGAVENTLRKGPA